VAQIRSELGPLRRSVLGMKADVTPTSSIGRSWTQLGSRAVKFAAVHQVCTQCWKKAGRLAWL
jgi:hypothetical protein